MTLPSRHRIFTCIAALALLGACGSAPRYEAVEASLRSGAYAQAAASVAASKSNYGSASALLFYLDQAWALHLAGQYADSNVQLEKAIRLMDELYTKSASGEALAFLGNDMSLPYQGENFERVFAHVLGLINYAVLGDFEAAQVEARRADEKLRQYSREMEGKVTYREDALARCLSAALYEREGRSGWSDAYIDLKKSDEAFGIYTSHYGTPYPSSLGAQLLRFARGLGERNEAEAYSARFGNLDAPSLDALRKERGEVLVLLYQGMAPVKVSDYLTLPIGLEDGTKQYFRAAFPRFESRAGGLFPARLGLAGQAPAVPFEVYSDLDAIARKDLEERVAKISFKAIARATAKFQAARAIQQKAKEAGGLAELAAFLGTNIYGLVSEQADTRSWRVLPARVLLARLVLPPGRHKLSVTVNYLQGPVELPLGEVEIRPGDKQFRHLSLY